LFKILCDQNLTQRNTCKEKLEFQYSIHVNVKMFVCVVNGGKPCI